MTVTKKDLVKAMAENMEMPKNVAEETVDYVFQTILATIKDGEKFKIAGFGTFRMKDKKAREARNPKTGEKVMVKASKTIAFRPEKSVKAAL